MAGRPENALPDTKGFSKRNLELIRRWHLFWLDSPIGQQPVAQIAKQPASQILSIPWGHNLPEALRGKLPSIEAIERKLALDVGDKA